MSLVGYLAPDGFTAELTHELGEVSEAHGRLLLAPGPVRQPAWAQNVWLDPRRLSVQSIGDAAKQLKAIQRNWALHSTSEHRRAALIQDKLPHVSKKPMAPFAPLPTAPLGAWTLLDRDTVLASPTTSSPFADGEPRFVEDTEGPPSRAYLKLWETFTLTRHWPKAGARVLDLGSAPGGWSFVLAELGAEVLSVDKAELDERVAKRPNVTHRRMSAFALEPDVGPVDWVFSDVICYPGRLLKLVHRWLDAGVERFVCTLKFQGETDHAIAEQFARIEGARLMHLSHNRHELTFVRLPADTDP